MLFKYETHLHTSESSLCGVASATEQVHLYKELGYTGIIVTDHFISGNSVSPGRMNSTKGRTIPWETHIDYFLKGYRIAKMEGDKVGLDVFLGLEHTFQTGQDLLIYGLSEEALYRNQWFNLYTLSKLYAMCKKEGAYVAQAHPYRERFYIRNQQPLDPNFLDGIEVLNASDPEKNNKKAMTFAQKHHLPMQAGSDCHHLSDAHSGIILRQRANDLADIVKAIAQGMVELIEP